MICPNSNILCERGVCYSDGCIILKIEKEKSLKKINSYFKTNNMNFDNDHIAVQVVNQLKELKINGVNLAGGEEYNRVFEVFYKIFKDTEEKDKEIVSLKNMLVFNKNLLDDANQEIERLANRVEVLRMSVGRSGEDYLLEISRKDKYIEVLKKTIEAK